MARKKGKGRAVRRARQKFGLHHEDEDVKSAPHTMVFHRGECNKGLRHLVKDMRRVMEPYTASSLKNTKKNNLKDFITIAGPLHVTHLMIFSETENAGYLKMVRLPRGPTLQFRIEEFSLNKDVISGLKKPSTNIKQFLHQPLLVLNGFHLNETAESKQKMHHKLMATTFQNMFPSINVAKVHLNEIKRCAMFNFNTDDETLDFRHYNIKISPVGLSKPVKKLVQDKIPDLSNLQDISEYMEKGGLMSESEAELDNAENKINVPEDMMSSRGNINLKDTTSAIRLTEIGPRLKLKLIKIQEGINEGEVLYHMFMNKTPEEIQIIRDNLKKNKQKQKFSSKKMKKEDENDKKKSKKRKFRDFEVNEKVEGEEDEIDDVEYFKKEVGSEPVDGFFQKYTADKRRNGTSKDDFTKLIEDAEEKKESDIDGDDDDDGAFIPKKPKIAQFETKAEIKKKKPLFLRFSNKKKLDIKNK